MKTAKENTYGFLDIRNRKAEELTWNAEMAEKAGRVDEARTLYTEAAWLYEEMIFGIPADAPRIRDVFVLGAVALYYRAKRYEKAKTVGEQYRGQVSSATLVRIADILKKCEEGSDG